MSYHKKNAMTQKEARARVDQIRNYAQAGDYEAAHSLEDLLYVKVLHAVASGSENAQALARIALETEEISFERWCA